MRTIRFLAAAAPVLLLVAACSSTITLSRSDVESEVGSGIAAQIGVAPEEVTVTCPGDLEATVGNTMTCQAATAADSGDVLVTITTVDGNDVGFDWAIVS